jgi:alpha-1,2-mannosyltransferase
LRRLLRPGSRPFLDTGREQVHHFRDADRAQVRPPGGRVDPVLARAGLDPRTPAGTVTWLAASAVVLALAWRGMRRASAASDHAWALSLNAFAALLISPVSWSHHWVWAAPALLLLAVRGLRDARRALLAAALAGLAVFTAAPQWWFPHADNREAHWAAWEQVIGCPYVILAVVILLIAACRNPVARQR